MRRHMLVFGLLAASCGGDAGDSGVTEITVQRIFGACEAEYGEVTDPSQAEGECGIITALTNRFNAENPEIRVKTNVVEWPGYDQFNAALASGEPPDLATMHQSAMPDYHERGLLVAIGEDLRAAGVDPADFTAASRRGVVISGDIYGLPFDTWGLLWHINLNLFARAGLVENGEPVLPSNPAELLAQARQFRQATGKPYFVQSMVNETAAYTRNFYTFLMQQNVEIFPEPHRIRLQTPEARDVVTLFKQIYDENLTTRNQDYSAATSGFIQGDGGVYIVGNWVIGDFEAQARMQGTPLSGGYTVVTVPKLYGERDVTYVDGHAWVMPRKRRSAAQHRAALKFLKFLADNNDVWARTGHLPAFRSVIEGEAFLSLPHRERIARLSATGEVLPEGVPRRFAIQDIIGEELASAITGQKPVDRALADAEARVNELLENL